ncbi:MAG: hypothetical protein WD801_00765 [Gemmatimonadaceae bacterium]
MIRRREIVAAISVAVVWMNAACGERDGAADRAALGAPHGEPTPDIARAKSDSGVLTLETTRNATLQPGALQTVYAAPVDNWQGPGSQPFEVALRTVDPTTALSRRFGTITMRTSLRVRAPDLGQYPCTSCHLGRRMVLADKRVVGAHENIQTAHPVQTGGACATCHAAGNVEFLALKSGERVTLDHTYRLCAQCHFAQAEAWAGGAHGKRLDGWQGRRVLMGCADCHDPHKPAIEPRIPFRAPRLERIRGRDQ